MYVLIMLQYSSFQFFTLDSIDVCKNNNINLEIEIVLSILYIGFVDHNTQPASYHPLSFNSLHWIHTRWVYCNSRKVFRTFNSLHWILQSGAGGKEAQCEGKCNFQFFTLDSKMDVVFNKWAKYCAFNSLHWIHYTCIHRLYKPASTIHLSFNSLHWIPSLIFDCVLWIVFTIHVDRRVGL